MNIISELWASFYKGISNLIFKHKWNVRKRAALSRFVKKDTSGCRIAKQILENQIAYIHTIAHPSQQRLFASGPDFDNFLFEVVTKVAKKILLLRQIVGVQPMSGPTGIIHSLQFKQQANGGQLSLEVVSEPTTAKTHKLQAKCTLTAMQDLSSIFGLDCFDELSTIVAEEVFHELFNHVRHDLWRVARKNNSVMMSRAPNETTSDYHMRIILTINQLANTIAMKTRRGAGNFLIVSPMAVPMFETLPFGIFVKATGDKGVDGTLVKVGTLNGTMAVYATIMSKDEIIIGYKGGSGEIDTGYMFCPYMPIISSGMIIDPNTYEPFLGMMTRNSHHFVNKGEDYYAHIAYDPF